MARGLRAPRCTIPAAGAVDGANSAFTVLSGRGRLHRRLAQGVFAVVACAGALAVSGIVYEAVAAGHDVRAYPPAGRLVDIGGFRLHITCTGAGSPTILLDAGLGGTSLDWAAIQPTLANTTRVCAYDRAGLGWSDPSPRARTPSNIADEIHLLLGNAGIAGPYLLVAHSLSGKSARLFAARHPEGVAGIVLIDARSEEMDARTTPAENRAFIEAVEAQGRRNALARRFGIARLFGANFAGSPSLPYRLRVTMALMSTQPDAILSTTAEAQARAASDSALRAAPLPGSLPLLVLVSGQSIEMSPHWAPGQRRLASLSSTGRLVLAPGSSHYIHWDRPGLVAASVREVVAQVRSRQPAAASAPSMPKGST